MLKSFSFIPKCEDFNYIHFFIFIFMGGGGSCAMNVIIAAHI